MVEVKEKGFWEKRMENLDNDRAHEFYKELEIHLKKRYSNMSDENFREQLSSSVFSVFSGTGNLANFISGKNLNQEQINTLHRLGAILYFVNGIPIGNAHIDFIFNEVIKGIEEGKDPVARFNSVITYLKTDKIKPIPYAEDTILITGYAFGNKGLEEDYKPKKITVSTKSPPATSSPKKQTPPPQVHSDLEIGPSPGRISLEELIPDPVAAEAISTRVSSREPLSKPPAETSLEKETNIKDRAYNKFHEIAIKRFGASEDISEKIKGAYDLAITSIDEYLGGKNISDTNKEIIYLLACNYWFIMGGGKIGKETFDSVFNNELLNAADIIAQFKENINKIPYVNLFGDLGSSYNRNLLFFTNNLISDDLAAQSRTERIKEIEELSKKVEDLEAKAKTQTKPPAPRQEMIREKQIPETPPPPLGDQITQDDTVTQTSPAPTDTVTQTPPPSIVTRPFTPSPSDMIREEINQNVHNQILIDRFQDYINTTQSEISDTLNDILISFSSQPEFVSSITNYISSDINVLIQFHSSYIKKTRSYFYPQNFELKDKIDQIAQNYSNMASISFSDSVNHVILFHTLSEFVSNQATPPQELLDSLRQNFNEIIFNPLLYEIMVEKYNISFSSNKEKKDIIYYLNKSDFDSLIKWSKNKNTELASFFISLKENIENFPSSNLNLATATLDPDSLTTSNFPINSFDEQLEVLRNDFEDAAQNIQLCILREMINISDPDKRINLLFSYIDIDKVYNHIIHQRISSIIDLDTPEQKIQGYIEARRGLLASSLFYLNQNGGLFTPGEYRSGGVNDCYDFASAVTTMSDLGLVFHSLDEMQAFYIYISTRGGGLAEFRYRFAKISNTQKNSQTFLNNQKELVEQVLKRSINSKSWDDQNKRILITMYAYIKGADETSLNPFEYSKLLVELNEFDPAPSKMNTNITKNFFLVKRLVRGESGNHLVGSWRAEKQLPNSLNEFKLSYYYEGGIPHNSLVGKWMCFEKCSPYTNSDHHGILTFDSQGKIILVDFAKNNEISKIDFEPPSPRLTKHGHRWYTTWEGKKNIEINNKTITSKGRKMTLRLTRVNTDIIYEEEIE